MSGETWTEYAVQMPRGHMSDPMPLDDARECAARLRASGYTAIVVGATATRGPWLPVDTEPQP